MLGVRRLYHVLPGWRGQCVAMRAVRYFSSGTEGQSQDPAER